MISITVYKKTLGGISTRNQHRVLFIPTRNQQLDFCHKELRPKSFVNPRHISEAIDKKLLEDITVVNYFLKVSMIWKSLLGITRRNFEQLGKLKLSKQLAKKKKKRKVKKK